MHATTLALVGATGGAGTTRTAVELATIGARDGRDVAVIDAAFTTQGLSEYVTGRIGTDLTTIVTDETGAPLSAATYPIELGSAGGAGAGDRGDDDPVDLPGRSDAIPARAPFERVARAKTAEAAQKLERRIDEAATVYDAVIVDTAPIGSNEAVAAITATDRAEAVHPATTHGRDALQRLRGRIADVGGSLDGSIAVARGPDAGSGATDSGAVGSGTTGSGADGRGGVDVVLPPTDPAMASAPTAAIGHGTYTRTIADAYASALDTSIGIEFEDPGLVDRLTP